MRQLTRCSVPNCHSCCAVVGAVVNAVVGVIVGAVGGEVVGAAKVVIRVGTKVFGDRPAGQFLRATL